MYHYYLEEITVFWVGFKWLLQGRRMNEEDRSRLENFRQFRREVRGLSEFLLVATDAAKDKRQSLVWYDNREDGANIKGSAENSTDCRNALNIVTVRAPMGFGGKPRTYRLQRLYLDLLR